MQYISLYRKYRPKCFSEVVGQKMVVKILQNSISNNTIGHAYIFSGPRGTGKTSIAKIFSKAVNCLNFENGDLCLKCDSCLNSDSNIDIIEIDAASNNGVDEIREIRNNAKLLPTNSKYKVYIIDEVHMLSTSAFNAILKTLEEPPKHVIFILATTEINKIPATVLSRCQKFDFKKINDTEIVERLKFILKKEKRTLDDDILSLIAKLSNGGLRDAINLLDQILSLNDNNITQTNVYNLIGDVSETEVFELFNSITSCNIKKTLEISNSYVENGINITNVITRLQEIVKNILIFNGTSNYFDKEYEKKLMNFSKIDINLIYKLSDELMEFNYIIKKSDNQKLVTDIYLLRMALMFNEELTKQNTNDNIKEDRNVSKFEDNSNNKDYDAINNKKILINNCLCKANKKLKLDFIEKFKKVSEYITSKEYNSIANLLMKSSVEVVCDESIIFTFKNNFEVLLFEKNIIEIIKFIEKITKIKVNVIAITDEEWKLIKEEYIKNINNGVKYKYINIDVDVKKNYQKNKKTEIESSVEDIFGTDYTNEN